MTPPPGHPSARRGTELRTNVSTMQAVDNPQQRGGQRVGAVPGGGAPFGSGNDASEPAAGPAAVFGFFRIDFLRAAFGGGPTG